MEKNQWETKIKLPMASVLLAPDGQKLVEDEIKHNLSHRRRGSAGKKNNNPDQETNNIIKKKKTNLHT